MKVITGKITSSFGGRNHPVEGIYKIHNGVDIAAPIGTEVYTPCSGVVVSVYSHPLGGLTLIIANSEKNMRYGMCHLDEVCVEQGQRIWAGDMVARSGNSGRSTGPHLHYSVKSGGRWLGEQYVGGKFVDSEPYIEFNVEQ